MAEIATKITMDFRVGETGRDRKAATAKVTTDNHGRLLNVDFIPDAPLDADELPDAVAEWVSDLHVDHLAQFAEKIGGVLSGRTD